MSGGPLSSGDHRSVVELNLLCLDVVVIVVEVIVVVIVDAVEIYLISSKSTKVKLIKVCLGLS